MEKIWLVIQESDVDGQQLVNVTPCASEETAKSVMKTEIETLLSENTSKYYGLNLDEVEKATQDPDNWDCDFNLERDDYKFYISCNCDDYHEFIEIVEKEIQY